MTGAASLLATFAADAAAAGRAPATAAVAPTRVLAAVGTEAITFAGPKGRTLLGAWAAATEPRGGVLVIHENRGLNDHIRSVAGRLAGDGYSALAIDLLSAEGGTDSFSDPRRRAGRSWPGAATDAKPRNPRREAARQAVEDDQARRAGAAAARSRAT